MVVSSAADAYATDHRRSTTGAGVRSSGSYYAATDSYGNGGQNIPSSPPQRPQQQQRQSQRGSMMQSQRGSMMQQVPAATNNAWAPEKDDDSEEEEDWNVYDDFNNVKPLSGGPESAGLGHTEYTQNSSSQDAAFRLNAPARQYSMTSTTDSPFATLNDEKRHSLLPSSAFGFDAQNGDPRNEGAKRASQIGTTPEEQQRNSYINVASQSGIELVTVPALGNEYTEEERRKMTRPFKRKTKRRAKKQSMMSWAKGENKLFGFLDPRMLVFIAFAFCLALALTLYFVIPRVPSFAFFGPKPFDAVPDGSGMSIGHTPTNFTMEMKANLRADNTASWITSQLSNLDVKVTNVNTYAQVGEGHMDSYTLPGRKQTIFQFPVQFKYISLNATGDATYLNFYKGCGPQYNDSPRPFLNLQLDLSFDVAGVIGRKTQSTQLDDIVCPFILQSSQ